MDPYLEEHWGDVHTRFMVYASSQLNRQLPNDLQARVEENLAVETVNRIERFIYSDVRIVAERSLGMAFDTPSESVAVIEPTEILLPSESPTSRHIEIIDTGSGNRVVTAIELLSPANKLDRAGREKYRKKQAEYIQVGVNLVEIDLLRSGEFVMAMPEERWPAKHQAPYKICIRRVLRPEIAQVVGIQLSDRLPNIPVPLRPTDADVALQLQPIIDDCYIDGRYASIDYHHPPRPPLSPSDELFADRLLRESGRR